MAPEGVSAPLRAGLFGVLTLVIAGAICYLVWQTGSLAARMDELSRQSVTTRDQLLAENAKLAAELARLQEELDSRRDVPSLPAPAAERPAPSPSPGAPSAPAGAQADRTFHYFQFLDSRLAPGDAAIAQRLYLGSPLGAIARQTSHSIGFVIVRGTQIERALSADPATPPELLGAIRKALERIKAEQ